MFEKRVELGVSSAIEGFYTVRTRVARSTGPLHTMQASTSSRVTPIVGLKMRKPAVLHRRVARMGATNTSDSRPPNSPPMEDGVKNDWFYSERGISQWVRIGVIDPERRQLFIKIHTSGTRSEAIPSRPISPSLHP